MTVTILNRLTGWMLHKRVRHHFQASASLILNYVEAEGEGDGEVKSQYMNWKHRFLYCATSKSGAMWLLPADVTWGIHTRLTCAVERFILLSPQWSIAEHHRGIEWLLPAQYLVFFVALAVSPFLCILAIAMSGSYEDYERVRNQCYVRAASEIFFFLAQREYLLFVFVICYLFASLCFLSLYRKWYLILCFLSFFCSLVLGIQCPFSPHS